MRVETVTPVERVRLIPAEELEAAQDLVRSGDWKPSWVLVGVAPGLMLPSGPMTDDEFTRVHSRKVLDGKATPDALLDVNRAVMRGLRPGAGAP